MAIYTPHENKETMFELPCYVIKSGRIIVEQGDIRHNHFGKTFHIAPKFDEDAESATMQSNSITRSNSATIW